MHIQRCTTVTTTVRRNSASTFPCGRDVGQRLLPPIPYPFVLARAYEPAFHASPPFMKEKGLQRTTCNDDGLCRMLYFSDD